MTTTGWLSEDPGGEVPDMRMTRLALARQENRAGPLETALARSRAEDARVAREEAAYAPDPDERAANLIAVGYSPGLLYELAQRLGDTTAELEAERDKLEKAARRAEIAAREHAAGRVDVFRMLSMLDGDEGDKDRVRVLERRAESLRRQIGEAQVMIAPQAQRSTDPFEAAAQRAHQAFAEVTRAKMADAQAGRRAPRPFASRGGAAEPSCPECAAAGASAEESFLIHSDPQPVTVPPAGGQEAVRGNFALAPVPGAVPYCRGCGQVPGACACTGTAYR